MEKHKNRMNHSLCLAVMVSLAVWSQAWAEETAQKPVESATATATDSTQATLTPSATSTSSVQVTASPTLTPVLSASPSVSAPESWTPTCTDTVTPSFTPTASATATASPTPTATPTVTSTPGVFVFSVSPKPDDQGDIRFKWGTTVSADEVFLGIYTSGYRVVRKFSFNKKENSEYLASGEHEYTWDGRDINKRPMAPGIYLCFIQVNVGIKRYEASGKTEIP
jgi:hypothetical protein